MSEKSLLDVINENRPEGRPADPVPAPWEPSKKWDLNLDWLVPVNVRCPTCFEVSQFDAWFDGGASCGHCSILHDGVICPKCFELFLRESPFDSAMMAMANYGDPEKLELIESCTLWRK